MHYCSLDTFLLEKVPLFYYGKELYLASYCLDL